MRNKLLRRAFAAVGIACCSMCLLVTPVASLPVQAAAGETTVSPQADIKEWIYMKADGKLWKRLWNGTAWRWETDWIYVRDL